MERQFVVLHFLSPILYGLTIKYDNKLSFWNQSSTTKIQTSITQSLTIPTNVETKCIIESFFHIEYKFANLVGDINLYLLITEVE